MTTDQDNPAPDNEEFLNALRELTSPLDWEVQSFTRDHELIAIVGLDNDPRFEQVLWVYDTEGLFVRCLLVSRAEVPPESEPAIMELCARINDRLSFGCAEYSFDDQTIIFRNSLDLRTCGPLERVMSDATSRVLSLGRRYAPAITAVLDGGNPKDAVAAIESDGPRNEREN
jgi:hypothetical protein